MNNSITVNGYEIVFRHLEDDRIQLLYVYDDIQDIFFQHGKVDFYNGQQFFELLEHLNNQGK